MEICCSLPLQLLRILEVFDVFGFDRGAAVEARLRQWRRLFEQFAGEHAELARFTLYVNLNQAGAVTYPATQLMRAGKFMDKGPKANALHAAGNQQL